MGVNNFNVEDCKKFIEEASGFEAEETLEIFAVSDLADMGFDSLNKLEAISKIEKQYGIKIPDDMVMTAATANDIVVIVNNKINGE